MTRPAGSGHTPPRSVRVPDDVWQAAKAEAERRGYILVSPYVRGQLGVWGLGEREALGVLDAIRQSYSIDPDRLFEVLLDWLAPRR